MAGQAVDLGPVACNRLGLFHPTLKRSKRQASRHPVERCDKNSYESGDI